MVSGVTDGGTGVRAAPWQAKCKKWAPLRDFMNCRISKRFTILICSTLLHSFN